MRSLGIAIVLLQIGACRGTPDLMAPGPAAHLELAVQALQANDASRALAHAESARVQVPMHPYPHAVKGQALYALGQFEHAFHAWQVAYNLEPRNWRWAQSLADAAFQAGRYSAALRYYQEAARIHPDPVSWHGGAGALWELGRPTETRQSCEQALELDSTYAPAHGCLSMVAEHAGDLERALLHAQAALQLDGRNPAYWLAAGRLERLRGRYHDAAALLSTAITLDPDHDEIRYNLELTLQRLE